MGWFLANWQSVVEIVLMVLGAASLVAKLTPTDVDNRVIDKIVSVIHAFGLTKKSS